MKTIINGKTYNTDTATKIATDSANCAVNDFNYWEETLYRTQKGAWFTYGKGGPMSRYAEPAFGGGWQGSSAVRVLSEAEARQWLEDHADTDTYLKYFDAEEA